MNPPQWLDSASRHFDKEFKYGMGSSRKIAKTVCEVVSFEHSKKRKGVLVVDKDCVDLGLCLYELVRQGEQPFEGIIIETSCPYRALII